MAAKTDFAVLVEWGLRYAFGSRALPATDEVVRENVRRLTAAAEAGDPSAAILLTDIAHRAAAFLIEDYLGETIPDLLARVATELDTDDD